MSDAYTRLSRLPASVERELREVGDETGMGFRAVVETLLRPRVSRAAVFEGMLALAGYVEEETVDTGTHLPLELRDRLHEVAEATRVGKGDVGTLILVGCAGQVRDTVAAATVAR